MLLPGVINSADSVGSDRTAAQTHRQASTPTPLVCFGPGEWSSSTCHTGRPASELLEGENSFLPRSSRSRARTRGRGLYPRILPTFPLSSCSLPLVWTSTL